MTEISLPPAPQPPSSKLKPGIGWYLAGSAILGAAVIGAGALFTVSLLGFIGAFDDFDRISLVDPTEVELEAGDQVVYLVGDDTDEGTDFGAEDLAVSGPDGDPLPVITLDDPPLATPEDVYTPRLQFNAVEDGTYRFEPSADADRDLAVDSVAVGEDAEGLVTDLGGPILISLAIGLVGGAIGTVLLIVTWVRRRRAKRRAAMGGGGPGFPSAPQPAPQGAGWGPPPEAPPAPLPGTWGAPPAAPAPPTAPPAAPQAAPPSSPPSGPSADPSTPTPAEPKPVDWSTAPKSGGHTSF